MEGNRNDKSCRPTLVTCVIVFQKFQTDNSVLFFDASNEFYRVVNNIKLTSKRIKKIVNGFVSGSDV